MKRLQCDTCRFTEQVADDWNLGIKAHDCMLFLMGRIADSLDHIAERMPGLER